MARMRRPRSMPRARPGGVGRGLGVVGVEGVEGARGGKATRGAEQRGDARDGAGGTARVSEQRGSEHSVGRGVGGGRWAAVGSDQVAGTRRGGRAGGVGGGGDAVVVGGSRCTRPSGSPAHGARGVITPEPTSAPSRPPCPCLLVGLGRRRRVIGRQAGGRAAGGGGGANVSGGSTAGARPSGSPAILVGRGSVTAGSNQRAGSGSGACVRARRRRSPSAWARGWR